MTSQSEVTKNYLVAHDSDQGVGRIAQRTFLGDNVMSAPVLGDVVSRDSARTRGVSAACGLSLQAWDKIRADRVPFHERDVAPAQNAGLALVA